MIEAITEFDDKWDWKNELASVQDRSDTPEWVKAKIDDILFVEEL